MIAQHCVQCIHPEVTSASMCKMGWHILDSYMVQMENRKGSRSSSSSCHYYNGKLLLAIWLQYFAGSQRSGKLKKDSKI